MGLVKLSIDRQNKTLVAFNGSSSELPKFFQTNEQQFRIQIVDPTDDLSAPYEALDCSGMELRLVIVDAVTGGDDTVLAATFEDDWAYDTDNDWFTGVVNFNTDEMTAFLENVASADAVLEINLMDGGIPTTVYGSNQGAKNITINSNGDDLTSSGPTPVDSYYNQSQTEALWLSGAGSPEGAVAAGAGRTYVQTTNPTKFWVKRTGTGVTGWDQLIG